jgi:hypothetical protein
MGYNEEILVKKNVFAQNYDEIRRLDGTRALISQDRRHLFATPWPLPNGHEPIRHRESKRSGGQVIFFCASHVEG